MNRGSPCLLRTLRLLSPKARRVTLPPLSHSNCLSVPPQGTRRLFVLIQGEAEGRAAAARVARALSQQGPARRADVLGSLVARTLRDRLALLSTLSVTARLPKPTFDMNHRALGPRNLLTSQIWHARLSTRNEPGKKEPNR